MIDADTTRIMQIAEQLGVKLPRKEPELPGSMLDTQGNYDPMSAAQIAPGPGVPNQRNLFPGLEEQVQAGATRSPFANILDAIGILPGIQNDSTAGRMMDMAGLFGSAPQMAEIPIGVKGPRLRSKPQATPTIDNIEPLPERQFVEAAAIKNKVPVQNLVTRDQSVGWLKERGLMPEEGTLWNPKEHIDRMVAHPDFQSLPVFDRARAMAVLERPTRQQIYSPVKQLGDKNTKMEGSKIYDVDTIRGCENECIECYALKGQAQAQITANVPVKATLEGKLPADGISRFGVVGDAATDWEWSNQQIRAALQRSPGVTPEKNIYFVTKLQDMTGFDPSIAKNIEVTLDPIFPAHMKTTMQNAIDLKTKYPDTNIIFRVRSVASNSPQLQASQKMATAFADAMGVPVLETRMRFIRNSTMDALELNRDAYKKVGNQFKLKEPQLKGESQRYGLCDSKNVGCAGCANCNKFVEKTFGKKGKALGVGSIYGAYQVLNTPLEGFMEQ